jgi:5-methylcytosine-specific restriction endonuclease McrA
MKKDYFNYDEHFLLFKLLYYKYNISIEDIAIILKSNSFTIRKYLKKWNLYDSEKSLHKNKINKINANGWNKLRSINVCQNCGWEGITDRAHIIPRKLGGTFKKNNILILCPNCHRMFDSFILDLTHLTKHL